jgi:hypothetical protein
MAVRTTVVRSLAYHGRHRPICQWIRDRVIAKSAVSEEPVYTSMEAYYWRTLEQHCRKATYQNCFIILVGNRIPILRRPAPWQMV